MFLARLFRLVFWFGGVQTSVAKRAPCKVAVGERLGAVEELIQHALSFQPAFYAIKKSVAV